MKVALAGEGADELFGGYPRYRTVRRARKLVGTLPRLTYDASEKLASVALAVRLHLAYAPGLWDSETAQLQHNCGLDCLRPRPDEFLDADHDDETSGLVEAVRKATATSLGADADQHMMTFDLSHRLPDDILIKSDHTSMTASLEVRVPFPNRRLVEFAHRLPMEYRVTPGDEKAVLTRAVSDVVPRRVRERDKHAMGIPVGSWFRSDHDTIACWLNEERLAETPYVDETIVRSIWDEHRSGGNDHGRTLWTVLSFVGWYDSVVAKNAPIAAV